MDVPTLSDVDKWPALITQHMARIMERLSGLGAWVNQQDVVHDLWRETGLQPHETRSWDDEDRVAAGHIEYTVFEAFRRLEQLGVVMPWGGDTPLQWTNEIPKSQGWDIPKNPYQKRKTEIYTLTALGAERAGQMAAPLGTRWTNVNELIEEATAARHLGLHNSAALVMRAAVEEAIRRAMDDLGIEYNDKTAAWQKERDLFESTRFSPRDFRPVDFSATRAILSALRDLGNSVAHEGHIAGPAEAFAMLQSGPRALASLSNATGSAGD